MGNICITQWCIPLSWLMIIIIIMTIMTLLKWRVDGSSRSPAAQRKEICRLVCGFSSDTSAASTELSCVGLLCVNQLWLFPAEFRRDQLHVIVICYSHWLKKINIKWQEPWKKNWITYWLHLDIFLKKLLESDDGLNITLQRKIYLTAVEMLLTCQKYLWLSPIFHPLCFFMFTFRCRVSCFFYVFVELKV